MQIKIDEKTPSILLCVYGSLRKFSTLYEHFLENKSTHMGQFVSLPEFTMYKAVGGLYPIVTPGTNTIVCDVFKIRVQAVLQNILTLEGCSGKLNNPDDMYQMQEIETPFGQAYIFIQEDYKGLDQDIIHSGNWLNRPLARKIYHPKRKPHEILR